MDGPPENSSFDATPGGWVAPESGAAARSGWAAPESGGEPTPKLSSARDWTIDHVETAAPEVPVPLRPMTSADVLDGAWAILKRRPGTVLGISAIIVVPVVLAVTWLSRDLTSSSLDLFNVNFGAGSNVSSQSSRQVDQFANLTRLAVLLIIETMPYMLLGGAIGRLVSAWYAGGNMTAWQACVASFKRAPALLSAWFLLLFAKVPAVAICFGYPFVAVVPVSFFCVVAPAIVIEGLGPIRGIQRSATLVSRRFWPVLGIVCLATLVEQIVRSALGLIPDLLAFFSVGRGTLSEVVSTMAQAGAHLITAPVLAGASVLVYLDLRVRTEGLDLELSATDAFAPSAA